MLVAESLPPTSEQLPLLGIYYAVTISIVSFSTAMAVITLNINNRGAKGRRCPKLLKFVFLTIVARILRTDIKNKPRKNKRPESAPITSIASLASHHHQKSTPSQPPPPPNLFNSFILLNNSANKATVKIAAKCNNYDNLVLSNNTNSASQMNNLSIINHQLKQHNHEEIIPLGGVDSLILESPDNLEDKLLIKSKNVNSKKTTTKQKQSSASPSKQIDSLTHSKSMFDNVIDNHHHLNHNLNDDESENFKLNWQHAAAIVVDSSPPTQTTNILQDLNNNSNNDNSIIHSSSGSASSGGSMMTHGQILFVNELEKMMEKHFGPLVRCLLIHIGKNEKRKIEEEYLNQIQSEWTDVALVADHFLCFFFPILTVFVCLMIFFNSPYVLASW
jgi:hypothetical protein